MSQSRSQWSQHKESLMWTRAVLYGISQRIPNSSLSLSSSPPLQITDHMSCHTVVVGVDKPTTVATGSRKYQHLCAKEAVVWGLSCSVPRAKHCVGSGLHSLTLKISTILPPVSYTITHRDRNSCWDGYKNTDSLWWSPRWSCVSSYTVQRPLEVMFWAASECFSLQLKEKYIV